MFLAYFAGIWVVEPAWALPYHPRTPRFHSAVHSSGPAAVVAGLVPASLRREPQQLAGPLARILDEQIDKAFLIAKPMRIAVGFVVPAVPVPFFGRE